MRDISKYQGIIPAFYACYDDEGAISPERVEELTRYMVRKGVKGLYVGGSSGECIYQSVSERKLVLEHVVKAAEGKLTIIAHVGCNNTADSMELAAHAQSLGVDALRRYLRFISICRSMRLRSTGMISLPRRLIRILLFTIFRSWPEWR